MASRPTKPVEMVDAPQVIVDDLVESEKNGIHAVAPNSSPLHLHSTVTDSSSALDKDALLALPPPPSYDVHIRDLSIAVPPYRAYIPTPIPILIPPFMSDAYRRLTKKSNAEGQTGDSDGLIVRNVSATVRQGEMLAIIGGSGSGKTTLLHAIAARLGNLPIASGGVHIIPSGSSTGAGGEGRFKGMSKVIGFVRQNDYLLPHLTVRETLKYAAELRLPTSVDARTRSLIVEQTIQELGLSEAANTLVGGAGRKGISGGEKRRLSIGCVLVSFPSVLVLDEVTTGLDSFTAFQLLETLSRLAQRGRTIILSVHQPRSDAFALFTRILLLTRGSVAYAGRTDGCLPHFAALGHALTDPATNPLDFVVDATSLDMRDPDAEAASRVRVERLVRAWRERAQEDSGEKERVPGQGVHIEERAIEGKPGVVGETMSGRRPNLLRQTVILVPRSTKNMLRGWPELIGHFLQAIILGALMGITFYKLGGQPNDIQSLKTLAFQIVPVFGYMTQVVWIYKWCTTLIVFDREREDNLYSPVSWLAGEFLAWLPVNIISPLIYSIMIYLICNLRRDDLGSNLGIFIGDMILVQLCFVAWALFAASIERSFARASLLGNALSIFFILSPGFFIVHVPGWIRWFRWLSPYFFSFRVITLTQFRNRTFTCEGVSGPALNQCSGDNALRALRISPSQPIAPMFGGLLAFIVIVLCISLVLLTFWKPGGVQHARRVVSDDRVRAEGGKDAAIDLMRSPVDVLARDVRLTHVKRVLPSLAKVETPILSGLDARFPSGEVTVLMGPSGSGKSTFLRMLANRPQKAGLLASFVPAGEITLNGAPISAETRRLCAFVEQEDEYHMPALTVRETLRYAAIIKLPTNVSRKRKMARAEEVLKMLGLGECADNMVGGELLKGISGGEKRRLSLACEMINDPAVLIADEPTSGLDANTARNVMEVLRDIARSGRTVIVSLHQPRSDIFQMGDNYVLLAKKGHVVYQGPREQLVPWFTSMGHPCPPLYNPSDFAMDLVSVDVRGRRKQAATTARLETLIQQWRDHNNKAEEASPDNHSPVNQHTGDQIDEPAEHTPFYISLPVILSRSWRNTYRQQDLFWTRFIQAPILAVCFFVFFLRLHKGPTGGQDRIGLIAECTSALPFVGFLNLVAVYPQEWHVFFHDYRSAGGRYSSRAFVSAFSLFAFLPELISAFLFTLIMHLGTGMQTNGRLFFEFAISIWTQLSFGESIGIAFASWFNAMGLAVSLVSCFLTISSQSSGIFSASVSGFLSGLAWIFPMKYAARVITINEFGGGITFSCSENDIQSGVCTAATGEQVLDLFGFHESTNWLMGAMVAITFAYRVFAWGVLALRMRHVS